jgi:hypothetical protein
MGLERLYRRLPGGAVEFGYLAHQMRRVVSARAARLPERLRHDPAVFRAELPALITTVEGLAVVVNGARCHHAAWRSTPSPYRGREHDENMARQSG